MKSISRKLFLALVFSLVFSGIFTAANAQSKTLFYWSFDHFNSGLATQGSPSLMKPIYASWSSTDTANGYISDVPVQGTSSKYLAYWDNYPIAEAGDTFNVQHGGLSGLTTGNLAMRLRNPNDSMQLLVTAPTTHYKNIVIKFDVFKSGSGPVKDLFDYSTDGGKTWSKTGLSIPSDSPNATSWIPVTVSISNTAIENNPSFVLRILTQGSNAISNGNDRFDNFSVSGDSIGGVTPPPPGLRLIHYWSFNNFTGLTGPVSVVNTPIAPIHANWSSLDSTKALLSYVPAFSNISKYYMTYWNSAVGDTMNARLKAPAGNELKVDNPSDSMQLLFTIPTTGYKNITIKFETQKSSTTSGQGEQLFSYSTNGGKSWKTSGLSVVKDSLPDKNWGLINVNINADDSANNNKSLLFRILFKIQNTGTSGNNRFDNVTVEGDTLTAVTPPPPGVRLIHYFNFNNFVGLTAAGSPSLITPIHANWSSLDSTKALISYIPAYNVSGKYATYWDVYPMTPADSNLNARMGAPAGNALRVRNPSDSMQLEFAFPTTHYKNIILKYGTEKSSLTSGQAKQVFDYSINGGATWKTTGLSIKSDSVINVTFNLITVSMATDTMINNNPNFIFRIKFVGQNSSTSGNNRFDNLTLEGDTDLAKTANVFSGIAVEQPTNSINCTLYPNPAQNQVILTTGSENAKTVSIYSIEGKLIRSTISSEMNVQMDISSLKTGVYILNVIENQTGKTAYLRLVKN